MRLIVFAVCLAVTSASAQVYRSVGEDGTVVYSDRPTPGAESVDLPPPSSFTPPPLPTFNAAPRNTSEDAAGNPAVEAYEAFSLVSPSPDEGVRENAGNVPFSFDVKPALQNGHQIRVLIDGQPVHESSEPSGNLENIERGTHTLSGELLDDGGRVLAISDAVEFHLLRVSIESTRKAAPN